MQRPTGRLPNLIVVMTDQQSSWTLTCYGGREIYTPNIDHVARDGVRFTNFVVNSACCTPSRGCFFTGLYPHRHRAHFNDIPLRRDVTTIAHLLRNRGYATCYVGKWHLDGDWESLQGALQIAGIDPDGMVVPESERVPRERGRWIPPERSMGFTDCRWMFNCSHAKWVDTDSQGEVRFRTEPTGASDRYMTDWLTDRAIEAVNRVLPGPFFLTLSIPDPHDPFSVRPPFDEMFDPAKLSVPETFQETNQPDWLRAPAVNHWHRPERVVGSETKLRRAKAQYLGEVACIDFNVGRLMAAIEDAGVLENTIVVFTTDHGEYMGEHGIYAKNQLYETAYRVPFIVRFPPSIPRARTVDRFLTTVDVQQTLLGLMGVEPSGDEQGRDASPLLRGEEFLDRQDEAFIYGTAFNRAGIITPEFQLAYVRGARDHILFDRRSDPLQTRNLFHESEYGGVVDELTERLVAHNRAVGAPEAEWLADLG